MIHAIDSNLRVSNVRMTSLASPRTSKLDISTVYVKVKLNDTQGELKAMALQLALSSHGQSRCRSAWNVLLIDVDFYFDSFRDDGIELFCAQVGSPSHTIC